MTDQLVAFGDSFTLYPSPISMKKLFPGGLLFCIFIIIYSAISFLYIRKVVNVDKVFLIRTHSAHSLNLELGEYLGFISYYTSCRYLMSFSVWYGTARGSNSLLRTYNCLGHFFECW